MATPIRPKNRACVHPPNRQALVARRPARPQRSLAAKASRSARRTPAASPSASIPASASPAPAKRQGSSSPSALTRSLAHCRQGGSCEAAMRPMVGLSNHAVGPLHGALLDRQGL